MLHCSVSVTGAANLLARQRQLPAAWHTAPLGRRSDERTETGDGAADHERVDLARALVGIDRLGIGHEPADVVIEEDAVAAQELARPSDRLARPHGAERLRQRGV